MLSTPVCWALIPRAAVRKALSMDALEFYEINRREWLTQARLEFAELSRDAPEDLVGRLQELLLSLEQPEVSDHFAHLG